ncbi:FAD-dependent oxidoreductase [Sinimarinibacterium thermocellulolyticum]|uniref:FAD-dependent oxidoreductase n=1 Tax=Sinimarinibacterium thermocellulolyticum TaxID=3170016 RepID=A0ABV2A7Q5_9GAMM
MANNDYDVLVIGGGGAGLSAACRAAEEGARVAVVEAHKFVGGSTALSGGVFYAANTSVQKAAGITDSAEAMFEYYMTLNQHKVHPSIVRVLCDESGNALEWLRSLGVEFLPEKLYVSGVESVARGHAPTQAGAGITAALEVKARELGVDIACGTRVRKLIVEGRRVVGADVGGAPVRAGSVVVATGGFGHNRLLLNRYYPEAAVHGDWTWAISAYTCRGDGLLMGMEAGADLDGLNRGLLLPTPGFYKDLDVMLPSWLVLVNRDGRRFVRENVEYAVMSGAIKEQLGGTVFAIFDDDARQHGKPDPAYEAYYKSGLLTFNWSTDRLDEQIKKKKVLRASSIEELAELVGVNAATLVTTIDRYNKDVEAGRDALFGKDASLMRTVVKPPFYAAEIKPAIVCLTSTGLRIDQEARVLNDADIPIHGLFAAGEVTGSVLGERYVGGGNSICNAVVFGRIAGREAAKHAIAASTTA